MDDAGAENWIPSDQSSTKQDRSMKTFWLTFPIALETQFEVACGIARGHALRVRVLCSLVIFDLFILVDWPILGNRIWLSAFIRFAVVTPAILAGELFLARNKHTIARELATCSLSTLIALSPLMIYHGTPLLVAIGHTALVVISIAGMTLVRLRTPYAFVQGVVLIACDVAFARLNTSMQLAEQVLFVSLVSTAVAFGFLSNRLLELEERKAFLSGLSDEAKNNELKLQAAALGAAANSIVITDVRGEIAWTNPAFSVLTGYSAEEVRGKNPRILKSGSQDKAFYAQMWATICAGRIWCGEVLNRRKDGSCYTEEMTITPVSVQQSEITHFVAIKQDITGRKKTEQTLFQAEEKYRAIFEDAVVGIFQATLEGRPVSVNRAFARLHGYDSPEQFLTEVTDVARNFVDPGRMNELRQILVEDGVVRGAEVEIYYRDHTRKWVLANLRLTRDVEGNLLLYEGTVEDVTARKLAEERVRFLAYHDALTGLPIRALLDDRLDQAFAQARRQNNRVALLYLDLDRFKFINDSFGHAIGDLFLQHVADRLKSRVREQETVARLGGDEFLVVLSDVKDLSDAKAGAERIVNAMNEVFVVQGHSIAIGCSLGVSIFPDHGTNGENLIKCADTAMFKAKELGRNNCRLFTEDMNGETMERLTLEKDLRLALDKNELFLVYQPQMEIATGKITGLEALLRWNHPELGLVPPNRFIPIAENCGAITSIGDWVLRTACSQARKWQDKGFLAVPVAVNVSAIQFRQRHFSELLKHLLHETALDPQCLELELTESLLLLNADTVTPVLKELKEMGVRLAIDDFGTGYSSLSYLRQFRVDKLKIDQSFIRNVVVDPDDAVITTAIIKLAQGLRLKVIAEGVETEAQLSFLRTQQCDEIQGYYFSRPLTVEKVADVLRNNPPPTHS